MPGQLERAGSIGESGPAAKSRGARCFRGSGRGSVAGLAGLEKVVGRADLLGMRTVRLPKPRVGPLVVAVGLVWVAGCGLHQDADAPASRLTEHQRDSVLARSALPGAGVVGRALDVSAISANHAAETDSLLH